MATLCLCYSTRAYPNQTTRFLFFGQMSKNLNQINRQKIWKKLCRESEFHGTTKTRYQFELVRKRVVWTKKLCANKSILTRFNRRWVQEGLVSRWTRGKLSDYLVGDATNSLKEKKKNFRIIFGRLNKWSNWIEWWECRVSVCVF